MKPYILIIIALLSLQTIHAQYGYGYPQQRRNTGYTQPRVQTQTPNQIERKDAATLVSEQMPQYVEALELDDFEKEIFKQLLIKHYEKKEALLTNPEIALTDKQDALEKYEDNFALELSSILSEDEIEKYKSMRYDKPESKKEKKRKKKKSKKQKDENKKGTP